MSNVQCYMTGIPDGDGMWGELELVIAESPEAAARLAYPKFSDKRIAEVLLKDDTYEIERYKPGDALILMDNAPRVIRDQDVMRSVGIHNEDDHECQCCGEWSEDVCGTCYRCSDPECRDAKEPCEDCDILPADGKEASCPPKN